MILRFVLPSLSKEKPFITALKSKLRLTMNDNSLAKNRTGHGTNILSCQFLNESVYGPVVIFPIEKNTVQCAFRLIIFREVKAIFTAVKSKERVEFTKNLTQMLYGNMFFSLSRILYKEVATFVLQTFVFT